LADFVAKVGLDNPGSVIVLRRIATRSIHDGPSEE
jgi:hypothetical protein